MIAFLSALPRSGSRSASDSGKIAAGTGVGVDFDVGVDNGVGIDTGAGVDTGLGTDAGAGVGVTTAAVFAKTMEDSRRAGMRA